MFKSIYRNQKNLLKISGGFIIIIGLIGLLISFARDIEIANQFESFFNQEKGRLFFAIQNKNFEKIGLPLIVSYSKTHQIYVLQLGHVSKVLCRRLIRTKIPFPHQFWIDGKQIDSSRSDLCDKISPRYMSFQFAANFRSFVHELSAEKPCQCKKPFISYGMCEGNCLHYTSCHQSPVCGWENE